MKIATSFPRKVSFRAEEKKSNIDKNPITKRGERSNLLLATVAAGICAGGRALFYLMEDGFVFDELFDYSYKKVEKNSLNLQKPKNNTLKHFGALGAVIIGFVAAVAALYTISKTPNIMYEGKVNAFKKGKDMDVYIKSNDIEKELYSQMNEKAKGASDDEKQVLSKQYLKLKAAKNQTPDFINKEKLAVPTN